MTVGPYFYDLPVFTGEAFPPFATDYRPRRKIETKRWA